MSNLYLEIRQTEEKGRGLFAKKRFEKGEIIFEEVPLVSCQLAWNEDFSYLACEYCLRPLETAEENVKRLTMNAFTNLPYADLSDVRKEFHSHCPHCRIKYCSKECMKAAWNEYHQTLCIHTHERRRGHPLLVLRELWKQMHYPPETTTIMLFMKIFAKIHQAEDKEAMKRVFNEFCHNTYNENENLTHKLLRLKYAEQVETLRVAVVNAAPREDVEEWLTPEGFIEIMALVGMNGQGIGTSSFSQWVKVVTQLDLPAAEREIVNECIEKIYDNFERGVGDYLNNEGAGLYKLQSRINHSCSPNAEVTFPHSNFKLAIRATSPIHSGEEICISYLEECVLGRSRHSRQTILRENYLFTCKCERCEEEIGQPDVTSSEESEMSE